MVKGAYRILSDDLDCDPITDSSTPFRFVKYLVVSGLRRETTTKLSNLHDYNILPSYLEIWNSRLIH